MVKDERNTYTIHQDPNLGEVKIADEVVAIIAALAATEVEGVASMAGNITNDLIAPTGNEEFIQRREGGCAGRNRDSIFGTCPEIWL